MTAADIEQLVASVPLAEGYHFVPLERAEVGTVIDFIAEWFPDISVGGASRYLREEFYARTVFFRDAPDGNNFVLLLRHDDELAGVFCCELDRETMSVYAALGVVARRHRGANLAYAGMTFTEAMARRMGMGYIYGMATLKSPYAQSAFERAGWQLIGITPGYDRELVAPGVVKRVYEAIYAKVLVTEAGLLHPQRQNLTPRTQSFFDQVFSTSPARTCL